MSRLKPFIFLTSFVFHLLDLNSAYASLTEEDFLESTAKFEKSTQHEEEILNFIIKRYESKSLLKFGFPIELKIDRNSHARQAWARISDKGIPSIGISEILFLEFEKEEIVFIACHEIGHLLGKITKFGEITRWPHSEPFAHMKSMEGEADYFAGSCLLEYLESQIISAPIEYSERISRSSFEKLYEAKIDENLALKESNEGIEMGYPSKECRLLSSLYGVLGENRPKCWYNPD